MPKIYVVSDSGARFSNARLFPNYPVTFIPYKIELDGKVYQEDAELDIDELMRLLKTQAQAPKLISPSVDEYVELYTNLSRTYDAIISIHSSREMSASWKNARQAAQQVADSCEVAVIDSQSICVGQGMLVRMACEAALAQSDFETAVRHVRGAVDRLYSVYYVESMTFLHHNGIMSEARSILSSMLGIKPFISIEEGKLTVVEKVKTRAQAIDHMVEFLSEFEELDDVAIVQNQSQMTDQARLLQDRLAVEFPGKHFPYAMYGMALGVLLGTDATGIVVLESEIEGLEDDY